MLIDASVRSDITASPFLFLACVQGLLGPNDYRMVYDFPVVVASDTAERKIRDARTGHARLFFGRPPIKYDPGPQREHDGVPIAPSRRGRGQYFGYLDADDARLVRTPRGPNDRTCLRRHVNRLRLIHELDRLDRAVSVHDRPLRGRKLTQQKPPRGHRTGCCDNTALTGLSTTHLVAGENEGERRER